MGVGDWFLDLISTVTKGDVDKALAELDSDKTVEEKVYRKKFSYRIFTEGDYWRWWVKIEHLDISIVCTKTFVSKDLARTNMSDVIGEMGWAIAE